MSELSKQLRDASERPTRNDLSIGHYWNFCSDAADQIERLERELAQARQDAERYCLVRRLNPNDFKRLWERNISENVPFDDLVDAARREGK